MSYPAGSILVFSDLNDSVQGDAVVLNNTTGAVLDSLSTMPYAGLGDRVSSGLFAVTVETGSPHSGVITSIKVFAADTTLIATNTSITVSPAMYSKSPIGSNNRDKFYIAARPTTGSAAVIVYTIDTAGALGGTTWTLPSASSIQVVAPLTDDSVLYWGANLGIANLGVIHAWDLVNNVALPDVVSMGTTVQFAHNMFVVNDTEILVLVGFSDADTYEVRRYSASGALLKTYDLGVAGAFDTPEMWRDIDPTAFWARGFYAEDGSTSTLMKFDLSSGTVLTTFSVTNLDGGGQVPATCPLITLGPQLPVQSLPPWPITPPFIAGSGGLQNDPIRRLRRSPHVFSDNKRVFLSRLEPYLRTGIGTTSGPGIDALVMLRVSRDGGNTYGTERMISAGELGNYVTRLQGYRFGQARDWVIELTVSDPNVPWVLADLFADLEEGTN